MFPMTIIEHVCRSRVVEPILFDGVVGPLFVPTLDVDYLSVQ